MEDKDKIENLFKERFDNFEAEVNPQVWNNVQSSLSQAGAAGSTGLSLVKLAAIVTVVAVSAVAGFYYLQSDQNIATTNTEVEKDAVKELNTDSKELEVIASNDIEEENLNETLEQESTPIVSTHESMEENNSGTQQAAKEPNSEEKPILSNNTENNTPVAKVEEQPVEDPIIEVTAATPNSIDVAAQSKVVASPMGGYAPLEVGFSTLAEVAEIKWDFQDGTSSTELAPNHTFNTPGLYFVTMLAKLKTGEVVMDKAVVEVKTKPKAKEVVKASTISVPDVFTPNGDGMNDLFTVDAEGMKSFSLSIYSVNGKLVYQTDNKDFEWNAVDMSGNKVVDGTYYYLINAIGEDGKIFAQKGYVTIIRGN